MLGWKMLIKFQISILVIRSNMQEVELNLNCSCNRTQPKLQ
jgi:hypothetical protein